MKQLLSVLTILLISICQVQSQVTITGTITSTDTTVPLDSIVVTLQYTDSSSITTDTVLTDSVGHYSSTVLAFNVYKVRVFLNSCWGSGNIISKTITKVFITSDTIDFTNYCFLSSFTHWQYDDTVNFVASRQGGVTPFSYRWNFGDGSPLFITGNPSTNKVYATGGAKNVRLFVVDSPGDTSLSNDSILVDGCKAGFTYTDSGLLLNFTDTSHSTGIPAYLWDFGDTDFSTLANPGHLYSAPGIYNVCLQITDSASHCTSRSCENIAVGNINCDADFSFKQSNSVCQFQDLSLTPVSLQVLRYQWDFGDMSASQDSSPVHTYLQNGTFSVSLVISDSSVGCFDSIAKQVSIAGIGADQSILGGMLFLRAKQHDGLIQLINGQSPPVVTDTMTTLDGYFAFPVDRNSVYYLKALPLQTDPAYSVIIPTYFPDKTNWNDASAILISNSSVLDNMIDFSELTPMLGTSSISGTVRYEKSQLGAEGISLYAYSQSGMVVQKSVSDANGKYQLSDLTIGDFEILPELTGKISIPRKINISGSGQDITNVDFTVFTDKIMGISTASNSFESVVKVYPNPVTDRVIILSENGFDFRFYDIAGRLVLAGEKIMSGHAEEVDLSGLKAGQYILCIHANDVESYFNVLKISD